MTVGENGGKFAGACRNQVGYWSAAAPVHFLCTYQTCPLCYYRCKLLLESRKLMTDLLSGVGEGIFSTPSV